MMKPNTLEHAEHLIRMAGWADSGFYQFQVDDGTLSLAKFKLSDHRPFCLLCVTSKEINNGLTSRQWNLLDAAIRTARKEGILK